MLWIDVLNDWLTERFFTYPKEITEKFFWNTSVLKNNGYIEYKENYKINNDLPIIQNTYDFQEYINNSKNKYVVSFSNLNKDTILVIPMPLLGKNYATLKDFIDNAPEIQQKEFWKEVANIAINLMKKHEKLWISVHGLGVPYTHVRISYKPKYYFDNELKKG